MSRPVSRALFGNVSRMCPRCVWVFFLTVLCVMACVPMCPPVCSCRVCVLECALGQGFFPLCFAVFSDVCWRSLLMFRLLCLRPALAQASRGRFSLTRRLALARSPEKLGAARPRSKRDHAISKHSYRLLRHAGDKAQRCARKLQIKTFEHVSPANIYERAAVHASKQRNCKSVSVCNKNIIILTENRAAPTSLSRVLHNIKIHGNPHNSEKSCRNLKPCDLNTISG